MQLRVAMERVGQREEVLAASKPESVALQTIGEIDALEQKLAEATQELRARRAEVQGAMKQSDQNDASETK